MSDEPTQHDDSSEAHREDKAEGKSFSVVLFFMAMALLCVGITMAIALHDMSP